MTDADLFLIVIISLLAGIAVTAVAFALMARARSSDTSAADDEPAAQQL